MTTVVVQDATGTANGAAGVLAGEGSGPDSRKDDVAAPAAPAQGLWRHRKRSAAQREAGPWEGQAPGAQAEPTRITLADCDAANRAVEQATAAAQAAVEHRDAVARERRASILLELAQLEHMLGLDRDPRTAEAAPQGPSAPPVRRRQRQARKARATAADAPTGRVARARGKGRLPRRSAAALKATLDAVVAACKRAGTAGLRAEVIRERLGLDRRELPRVLRLGVTGKRLRKSGQKRATVYRAR